MIVALRRLAERSAATFLFLVACVAGVPLAGSEAAHRRDPAVVGQWGPPQDFPIIGIHAILLPTGKVLYYSHPGEMGHSVPPVVWDPATGAVTAAPVGRHLFCSGHSLLPDGMVLVTGGDEPDPDFGKFEGLLDAHIFDPFAETWTRIGDMSVGRWYPTNVTLGDGRVLVVSGLDENGELTDVIEIFTPDGLGGGTWQVLTGVQGQVPLYPFLHLLPSGEIFLAGPAASTGKLDVSSSSWTPVAETNRPHYEGTSVLLPPDQSRILVHGGRRRRRTEIIDLGEPVPSWELIRSRFTGRRNVNATILPDGRVLFSGGGRRAALFDPATDTFERAARLKVRRRYHSTALLLPDGRVAAAGGEGGADNHSIEIYSPPYLFAGPRPTYAGAPAATTYGAAFSVTTADAGSIASVVFMRPSAVTHSVNMEQRYVELAFSATAGQLNIDAPSDPNLAPPGYYMLFVVSAAGVPSEASFVRLGP